MTATYFILLDLKSRNRPIRLLPNRMQQITSQTIYGHNDQSNSIPSNILREANHEPNALKAQQDKTYVSMNKESKATYKQYNNSKTPNKENTENSQTRRDEQATPKFKY